MTKRIISGIVALTLLAGLGLVGACTEAVQAKTGTIEVRVTDAPPGYTVTSIKIWVAEEGVEVHKAGDDGEGGWLPIDIVEGKNPFELLDYIGGLQGVLAMGELEAGRYSQMRMTIDKVEVTILEDGETEGTTYEAELPSGKLKFVRPFDVIGGETTTLVLDFIAEKSVVVTGAKKDDTAKVKFKPVIKLDIQQGGKPHELTSVVGAISAVDTEASTISINPTGGGIEDDTIVLDVDPQTEITLDGVAATLEDLAVGQSVTASYYLNNLKATEIDALSP